MKAIGLVVAAAAALFSTSALAQDAGTSLYVSGGYSHVGVEGSNLDGITARVGANFIPQFGVEAEGTIGFGSEKSGTDELSLQHDFAGYIVGALPMTDNARLIGRVGYGSTSVKVKSGSSSSDEDFTSYRYGVGAEFFFDDANTNGLRIDYLRIDAEDGIDADVYSISYVRRLR